MVDRSDRGAAADAAATVDEASPGTITRQAGEKTKRERTRARLIDAAAELIGRHGAETVTIAQITEAAGLAKGTFYNYFDDRDAIIAETALSIIEQVRRQIHNAGRNEADPVDRFAAGGRRFLDFVASHPTWAGAVLRSVDYLPGLRPRVYEHVASAVRAGKETGDFGADDWLTIFILNSMLFAAARASIAGTAPDDVGPRTAEMQLLMLGTDPSKADAAARRPIDPIDFSVME